MGLAVPTPHLIILRAMLQFKFVWGEGGWMGCILLIFAWNACLELRHALLNYNSNFVTFPLLLYNLVLCYCVKNTRYFENLKQFFFFCFCILAYIYPWAWVLGVWNCHKGTPQSSWRSGLKTFYHQQHSESSHYHVNIPVWFRGLHSFLPTATLLSYIWLLYVNSSPNAHNLVLRTNNWCVWPTKRRSCKGELGLPNLSKHPSTIGN